MLWEVVFSLLRFYLSMKIFVTGTSGFIGFHLARRLLEEGHQVIGLDNFNPYYDTRLKEARHAVLAKFQNFLSYRGDLCDRPLLDRILVDHTPDALVNLAAQAGVRYSFEHPEEYIRSNVTGFLNILEVVRRAPTKIPLIYASSSSVYGANTQFPFSEDQPTETPLSLYAASKKSNELIAHSYANLYGITTIGLRFFSVYGPWGRPDMALWLFTEKMLRGEPIQVFNNGNMWRDFTYIDDIVAGIVGVIDATIAGSIAGCQIYNIGNDQSEKLMDLIGILERELGVKAKMELLPMQDGDVLKTHADISRLQKAVGYAPTTPISEGIPKFVKWYRDEWLPAIK